MVAMAAELIRNQGARDTATNHHHFALVISGKLWEGFQQAVFYSPKGIATF